MSLNRAVRMFSKENKNKLLNISTHSRMLSTSMAFWSCTFLVVLVNDTAHDTPTHETSTAMSDACAVFISAARMPRTQLSAL